MQKTILILTLPVPGHMNPGLRIAEQLVQKGHSVLLATLRDTLSLIPSKSAVHPLVFGETTFPAGSLIQKHSRSTQKTGIRAFASSLGFLQKFNFAVTNDLYQKTIPLKINLVVSDELVTSGKLLADQLGARFCSFAAALSILPDRDGICPLPHSARLPSRSSGQRWTNQGALLFLDYWTRASLKDVAGNFQPQRIRVRKLENTFSTELHLSLCPKAFDFQRLNIPMHYRYALPPHLVDTAETTEKASVSKPILYASLGTLIHPSKRKRILREASFAGEALGFETHIGLGSWFKTTSDREGFHPDSHVYEMAPQLDLLKKADLVITHGGMNTVMEALSFGKPLISIPYNQDQFGVSSRLRCHGLGRVLKFQSLDRKTLSAELKNSFADSHTRQQAMKFKNHFNPLITPTPGACIHDHFFN